MNEPIMSIGVCCSYKLWGQCNTESSLFISPPQTSLDDQGLAPLRYKNIGRTTELETTESQEALKSNTKFTGNRAKGSKLIP